MSPGIANSRNIRAGAAYIELTTQDSKLVRGLDRAQKRVKAFGKSVGEIGKRLTAVSAVAAVPLLSGLKIYADFQQQMATVATMLSDSDAEKYMDSFTKGIRKMAVSFGESTEALSGGLYDILSASIAPAISPGSSLPAPVQPKRDPLHHSHLPLLSCLHTLPACTPCPPSPMLHASVRNFHPLVLFRRSRQGQGRGGGPQACP